MKFEKIINFYIKSVIPQPYRYLHRLRREMTMQGFPIFFPRFIYHVGGFTAAAKMLIHGILLAFYYHFVTLPIFESVLAASLLFDVLLSCGVLVFHPSVQVFFFIISIFCI